MHRFRVTSHGAAPELGDPDLTADTVDSRRLARQQALYTDSGEPVNSILKIKPKG